MNEHVRMAIEERVLCVTLNRPEKKNALTQEMYVGGGGQLRRRQGCADHRIR
jgi:enoyl-CoA hydratase/carnithine racemase